MFSNGKKIEAILIRLSQLEISDAAKSEEITSLQKQRHQDEQNFFTLRNEKFASQKETQHVLSRLSQLEKRDAAKSEEITSLQKQRHQDEQTFFTLRNENIASQNEINRIKLKNSSLKEKIVELQCKVAAVQIQPISSLKNEIEKAVFDAENIKRDVQTIRRKAQKMADLIETIQIQPISKLQKEIRKAITEIGNVKEDVQTVTKTTQVIEANFHQMSALRKVLSRALLDRQITIPELDKKVDDLNKRTASYENKLDKVATHNTDMATKVDRLSLRNSAPTPVNRFSHVVDVDGLRFKRYSAPNNELIFGRLRIDVDGLRVDVDGLRAGVVGLTEKTASIENRIDAKPTYSGQTCAGCGGPHSRDVCRHKAAVCRYCNKTGHIERVCRLKKRSED